MELICDLCDFDENILELNNAEDGNKILSESALIPKEGFFLGLDISETSTGICLYENGEKISGNITLETKDTEEFREVKLRRELKSNLEELISGKTLDLIIVEDVFQGINPQGTRVLYALNTAIDELILDGVCKCKNFMRVSNKTWKSWLFSIDKEDEFKGLNDKIRIQKCLELLEVYDEGEGFQDRLDSCGMVLGYFLCKESILENLEQKKKKRVQYEDIACGYQEDIELALLDIDRDEYEKVLVFEKRWSKAKILDYLTNSPMSVFVSQEPLMLGNTAITLGLPYLEEGGYLAFWVKSNKLKKYV